MKLTFWFTLFALGCFAIADDSLINSTTPNFLLGTWYSNGPSWNPDNINSCIPQGTIQIVSDPNNASQVLLNATDWNGTLCEELGMNQSYVLNIPFAGNSSFNDIYYQGWTYNNLKIYMDLYYLNYTFSFPNGSQYVGVVVGFDYYNVQNVTNGNVSFYWLSKETKIPQPPIITEATPNLLLASWSSNGTYPIDLGNASCCVPLGHIHIFSDMTNASQVFLIASQWGGALCSNFFIDSYYLMRIPFVNVSSYADLLVQGFYRLHNNLNVTFSVSGFNSSNYFANWTQEVLMDLELDYADTVFDGESCSVTISRPYNTFDQSIERNILDMVGS